MDFDVLVDGQRSGTHVVTFEPADGGILARARTDIRVTLAFVPVYRFALETEERWMGGGAWSFYRTAGEENGERFSVKAERRADGVILNGRPVRAARVVPASFWSDALLNDGQVIDPAKGVLVPHRVWRTGTQPVGAMGRELAATAYGVDSFVDGTVWYGRDGAWLGGAFDRKGHRVEYARTR